MTPREQRNILFQATEQDAPSEFVLIDPTGAQPPQQGSYREQRMTLFEVREQDADSPYNMVSRNL